MGQWGEAKPSRAVAARLLQHKRALSWVQTLTASAAQNCMRVLGMMLCAALPQVSTLTRLQDFRLKVREIEVDGIHALRSLRDLRSFDLEVRPFRQRRLNAPYHPTPCIDSLDVGVVSPSACQPCNGRISTSIVVPVHVTPEPCDMRAVRSCESL